MFTWVKRHKKVFSAGLSVALFLFMALTNSIHVEAKPTNNRFAGASRYETSISISQQGWQQSDYAILANGEGFADALSAVPLAKKYNAPILLSDKQQLSSSLKNEIVRLKVKHIFITGGTGAISSNIENQLKQMSIDTVRLSGSTRYETSIKIAEQLGDNVSQVVIAYGENYPDALSIAPIAAGLGMPIILSPKDDLPQVAKDYLSTKNITKSYVVGGTGAISDNLLNKLPNSERLSGTDRYETNISIVNHFKGQLDLSSIYVATGENFADALSGSALAALTKSPILLTNNGMISKAEQFISDNKDNIKSLIALGGEGVVSSKILDKINSIIDGTSNINPLKVHYIDVGQADCILIQTPAGKNMLIDAGNVEDGNKIVSYLQNLGITKLDIVAGTHPHEDHIGGMAQVINMFQVGKIYMPKVSTTTKTYEDTLKAIANKGLTITQPISGANVDLDSSLKLQILAPNSGSYDDLNDYSIVFKLTYGSKSFLFTGDAQALSESEMLNKGYDLSADVLKVGHHGSNTSTSDAFLKAVSPKYAVISVGKNNSYGHPAQTTIDKLLNSGATVYRTDQNGTIVATCDGQNISFSCQTGSGNSNPGTTSKISVSIDNPTPAQNSTVHVTVTGPVGATANLLCHYKSTTTPYSGVIGSDGKTTIAIPIGRASAGYKVVVEVSIAYNGKMYYDGTAFTPQ